MDVCNKRKSHDPFSRNLFTYIFTIKPKCSLEISIFPFYRKMYQMLLETLLLIVYPSIYEGDQYICVSTKLFFYVLHIVYQPLFIKEECCVSVGKHCFSYSSPSRLPYRPNKVRCRPPGVAVAGGRLGRTDGVRVEVRVRAGVAYNVCGTVSSQELCLTQQTILRQYVTKRPGKNNR